MAVWTNPLTWTIGQILTAAQMNQQLRDNTQFLYDRINVVAAQTLDPGCIVDFAGPTAPSGWLMCDGTAVSRFTYSALFAAIGTTWGAGDGTNTFNLPDLRGRASIGAGTGAGLTARALAGAGGEETHLLTLAESAAHAHVQNSHTHALTDPTHGHTGTVPIGQSNASSGSANFTVTGGFQQALTINNSSSGVTIAAATATDQNAGGGSTHNNMQPFSVVNKIIRT